MHNSPEIPTRLTELAKAIATTGGRAWLVGGSVRDMLMGIPPKDFDLEVYGLSRDRLNKILKEFGRTEEVGRQFGISKCWIDGKLEIDVALPRTESKATTGHRGFIIHSDPNLTPEIASQRRDFTINAMMLDPLSGQIADFHNGRADLEQRTLRHVSPAFSEDPLRPLRAMQFAARFAMTLAPESAALCQSLIGEAATLPASRIWCEWRKWALSEHPSYGLQALRDSGWISLYPELEAMIDCHQEPHWHPEGSVWNHTLLTCDQAAVVARRNALNDEHCSTLLFAALCHDFGKPLTTKISDSGRICSPGHAEAGVAPSMTFLERIAAPKQLFNHIEPLVREHITHLHGKPTARAVRRLAVRLQPSNIEMWEMLVEADASGRAPAPPSRPAAEWLTAATTLQNHRNAPEAMITGKMLIERGIVAGPALGKILKTAYQAQLDGEFDSLQTAAEWLNSYIAAEGSIERN